MQELLKQVQEIFPEANNWNRPGREIEIPNRLRGLSIDAHPSGVIYLYAGKGERYICESKDFSKILAVLRAIKECE